MVWVAVVLVVKLFCFIVFCLFYALMVWVGCPTVYDWLVLFLLFSVNAIFVFFVFGCVFYAFVLSCLVCVVRVVFMCLFFLLDGLSLCCLRWCVGVVAVFCHGLFVLRAVFLFVWLLLLLDVLYVCCFCFCFFWYCIVCVVWLFLIWGVWFTCWFNHGWFVLCFCISVFFCCWVLWSSVLVWFSVAFLLMWGLLCFVCVVCDFIHVFVLVGSSMFIHACVGFAFC